MTNPLFPLMPQELGDEAEDHLFGDKRLQMSYVGHSPLENGGTILNGQLNIINGTGSETITLNSVHEDGAEDTTVKNTGTGKAIVQAGGSDTIILMDGQSVASYDVSAASAVQFTAPAGEVGAARAWHVVE